MKISKLQKYILKTTFASRDRKLSRKGFEKYYANYKRKPKKDDVQNIITKSIERLIEKEMIIGYGRRTPHKLFINEISLTVKGRKAAKTLFGQQQKLPFKIKNRRKK